MDDLTRIKEKIQCDVSDATDKAVAATWRKKYNELLKYSRRQTEALQFASDIGTHKFNVEQWGCGKSRGKETKATPAVILSDWHVGELVTKESSRGKNEYNPKIASRRIRRVLGKIPEYIERYCPMGKELYVGLLGDFTTGWIHEELIETNTMTPVEESIFFMDELVTGLESIKKDLRAAGIRKVHFIPKPGNHGRITKERRDSNECETSFEWISYHSCHRYLRRDPFYNSWLFTKSYFSEVTIQGHRTRWHHGHEIPGSRQFANCVNKKIAEFNESELQSVDCDLFGHHHHFNEADNWVSNSSLIGYTGRSDRKGYRLEAPSQAFVVFSQNRGKHHTVRMFAED